MATFVYLSEEILTQAANSNPNLKEYQVGVFKIERDIDGRLIFAILNERAPLSVRVPAALKPFVEAVSIVRRIPDDPIRIYGIYRYEDAEAEVDAERGEDWLTVSIDSPRLESARELYRLIREGKIAPAESWENLQPGTEPEYWDDDPKVESDGHQIWRWRTPGGKNYLN